MAADFDDTSALLARLADDVRSQLTQRSVALLEQARDLSRRIGTHALERSASTPTDVEAFVHAVKASIRPEGVSDGLRLRDARTAMALLSRFTDDEVAALLMWKPALWRDFIRALFKQKTDLDAARWARWARLVRVAPRNVMPLLDGAIDINALLEPDPVSGARAIARQCGDVGSMVDLDARICAPGYLDRGWKFTSLVFASWAALRPTRWPQVLAEVTQEGVFEAMLLPRSPSGSSWSRRAGAPFPRSVPEHPAATARFVAATLGVHIRGDHRDQHAATELRSWLIKAWGDPRKFARPKQDPKGWSEFAAVDRRAYDKLVDELFSDDISVFFESATDFNRERKAYWQKWVRSFQGTTFLLCRQTRANLRVRLPIDAAARARYVSVLDRSLVLETNQELDALVFRFNRGAVVEFSKTGNAAYLYDGADCEPIEKAITRAERTGARLGATDLKIRNRATRLLHQSSWQYKFDAHLHRML